MKKQSDEEFGILITREMKAMMLNDTLSYEQRAILFCAIITDAKLDDPLLSAFAESLKVGYISTNNKRKAEILSRRERQKRYQRNLRTSTEIDDYERKSAFVSVDERASLNKAKQSKAKHNIPLSPSGKGEPSAITVEDILRGEGAAAAELESGDGNFASEFAAEIAQTYPYKVNIENLSKTLSRLQKKFPARAIRDGYLAWRDHGWTEPRFFPRRIVAWFQAEQFTELPPATEKTPPRDPSLVAGESDMTKAEDNDDGM